MYRDDSNSRVWSFLHTSKPTKVSFGGMVLIKSPRSSQHGLMGHGTGCMGPCSTKFGSDRDS